MIEIEGGINVLMIRIYFMALKTNIDGAFRLEIKFKAKMIKNIKIDDLLPVQ